jgi:tetratricopeptide (TPR) repeat protein
VVRPLDPHRTLDLENDEQVARALPFAPGFTVGRFRIVRELGRGGMGVVFEAYDPELDRRVAIKIVRDRGAGSAAGVRLIGEAQAMARLGHPNVVAVHEVGTIDNQVFLVMELVAGETFASWLETVRPWREVVSAFLQAGEGLAAAHHAGLVHRDFKPANVLVDATGRARVGDFGLARSGEEPIADGSDTPRLVVGTPGYMAPEQRVGDPVDARADQYAFAVSLQEALSGRRVLGKVPRRIRAALERALAMDPDARYPTIDELLVQLRRALSKRRRWIVAAAVTVAVSAGAALLVSRLAAPADDCTRAASLVDSLWNGDAKLAQARAFRAARSGAEPTVATTGRLVDDWAASWRLGRKAACHAEQARAACLDRELADLRAQLAVWSAADKNVVDRAVAAAAALPAPSACAGRIGAPWLASGPLVGRIAQLEAMQRSGRSAAARPMIAGVLADAEATGDAGVVATTLLAAGRIERDTADFATARDHLARAAQEAGRAGDDNVLASSLVFESFVASDQGRPLDGLGLIEAARAVAARGYDRPDRLALAHGEALRDAGRSLEGIAELGRAVEMLEARAAREPAARVDLAAAIGGLASAYTDHYEYDRAIELHHQALAIEEADLGPNHPEVAKTLHDLANAETKKSHFADAEAHYQRARAIFVAAYGERHELVADSDVSLAGLALQQDKDDLAEQRYLLALEELAELPADHPTRGIVEEALGSIARDRDRCKDGIVHFERALTIYEHAGRGGPPYASLLVNAGACYADVGRDADARATLERASEIYAAAHVPDKSLGELWALQADLEAKAGRRPHAIELANRVLAATSDDDGPAYKQLRSYEREQLAKWKK